MDWTTLSRVSVLDGIAKDKDTDLLYEPLRKTFRQDTTYKKKQINMAIKTSNVSNRSVVRNLQQSQRLGKQVLIPEDAKLKRCYDLSILPKNQKFCVVNSQEKQLNPISREQLEQRLKTKNKEQIIVYTYGNEMSTELSSKPIKLKAKNYNFRKSIVNVAKKQPRYNLFSILDEGVNNLLEGKACTCPSNQIIAEQKYEVHWQGLDKN